MLEVTTKQWHRDGFLISSDSSLIDAEAVNAAFDSDLIYWGKALEIEDLKRMLRNSHCFGVYALPLSTSEIAGASFLLAHKASTSNYSPGRKNPPMIGFARLITDEVTFAYLTDVYIIQEQQGKGLGKWLVDCVHETLESWPMLRRMLLLTGSTRSVEFYRQRMNAEVFEQNEEGLVIMGRRGRGSTRYP